MTRPPTIALVLLFGLTLAGCGTPDESIPPALAELRQRAALRWIGKAASQGNAAAQFELGSYYTLEPHRDFGRAADLRRGA